MPNETVHVLLIEDDEVDVEVLQRGFLRHQFTNPILVAPDGIVALEMLRRRGVPRPNMVLVDMNMPRMDGIEFLQAIRKDDDLRDLVIFVLTTSDNERDKVAAYDHNVAGYLVKSKMGEGFDHLMALLGCYFRYVELPPRRN